MAAMQQFHEGKADESHGWTRQKLLDLVDAYKNRPCLYNNTGPGYHNREERARSWIEISELMSREEEEVRAKMKSIRTQYARIIQKGQHPKCKTASTVSSWWLLESLSFLDEFISPRKADSESIKESDMIDVSQVGRIYPDDSLLENGDVAEMIYDDVHIPQVGTDVPPQTLGNSLHNSGHPQLEETTVIRDSPPYHSPFTRRIPPITISRSSISSFRSNRLKVRKPLKKQKRDHAVAASPAPAAAPARRNSPSKPAEEADLGSSNLLLKTVLAFAERTSRDDDEDAIFGRYVGNEMRNVSDEQAKRIAKMRIQKVLFEAQTGWTETSNEGIYNAPRDGSGMSQESNYPIGIVCNTNNSRVI